MRMTLRSVPCADFVLFSRSEVSLSGLTCRYSEVRTHAGFTADNRNLSIRSGCDAKKHQVARFKMSSAMLALSFGLVACAGGNGDDAPVVSAAAGAGVSDLVALLHVPVAASSPAVVINTTPAPAPAPVLTHDLSCGLNDPAGI